MPIDGHGAHTRCPLGTETSLCRQCSGGYELGSRIEGQAADVWLAQGQINIFSYLVSVETTQLCCCVQNQWAWLCSDKSFFTTTGGELDLAHNLPKPA